MAPRIRKPAFRKKDDSTGKGSGKRDRIDRRRRDRTAPEKAATGRTGKGRRRIDKSRAKGRLGRSTQEKLKRWLETPADWARFNAWAEINAQPKKIPEPEDIVRPTKPLSQLRRRLKMLAQPREVVDPSTHCKLDLSVSKAALNAVASIRTNLLALPIVKLPDYGRIYYQVSPAALNYEPSQRIIALSQPHYIPPDQCKPPAARLCQPRPDMERLKMLAMKRKLLRCPEQLTEEEIEELFTAQGTRRSALVYQITPWMEFLALPPYKTIKRRKDEDAVTWKKTIINEGEKRGKDAMVEHLKKRAKERRRERRLKMLRKKLCEQEKERKRREKEAEEEERRRRRYKNTRNECEDEATMRYEDEKRKEHMEEKKRKHEKKMKRRKDTRDDGDTKKVARKGETEEKVSEEDKAKMKEEEERRKKKRRKRKHAWRFAPYPCKENPQPIKKETLQFEATARMTKLSEPRDRKDRVTKANPFTVKKAALSASASGRVEDLAKPSRPRSPIERKPPREKDAYGRPIFVVPVYGKVLPKTKPYKMGECPPEEEEKKKKKKVAKKRPIDSIAYEPTYDPCIDPDLAKRQKRERKRAAKLSSKKKEHPEVEAPIGRIRGSIFNSRLGRKIYSFRGVRYGEPPTGDRRFQVAKTAADWNNVFDASMEGLSCPGLNVNVPMSVDCLRLNVYTTKLPSATETVNRSVLVFFHPGGCYLLSHSEIPMVELYASIWANFVQTGEPISKSGALKKIKWDKFDTTQDNYLKINENSTMKTNSTINYLFNFLYH